MLNSTQNGLVQDLRKEAHQVKECAVQYFVRSIIFVSAFLGVIISLMPFSEYVSLASIFVLPILFANTKILLHKYGTANRNLGYELHLERSQHFKELYSSKESWSEEYGDIGWEEAMRAWRIVQATVFEEVCEKKYNTYNDKVLKNTKYPWFDIHKLINKNDSGEGASYYASSFMKHMISVITVLMFASLVPPLIFIGISANELHIWESIVAGAILIASTLYIAKIIKFTKGRRNQLEHGILSISSCSIMWHAVILAHFRALDARKKLKSKNRVREDSYAYNISIQAERLADNVGDIHGWIEGKWLRKTERSVYTNPRLVNTIEPFNSTLEIVDHSSGGIGALIDQDVDIEKGDKLIFKEEDIISGVVVYTGKVNEHGKKMVGVNFLASHVV